MAQLRARCLRCASHTFSAPVTPTPRPQHPPPHAACRPANPPRPRLQHAAQKRFASFRTASPEKGIRGLVRKHPVAAPLGFAAVLLGGAGFAYGSYLYARMYWQLGSYPEKVGLKLRRGIYFTDVKEDPAQALKAFLQALQLAQEAGMDGLGDEVIGIKTELCRFLEKSGNVDKAIEVYETLKTDLAVWMDAHAAKPEAFVRRARLLKWSVRVSTKLASLYSGPGIRDATKTEEHLTWAVETVLRERQRRDTEGAKDGEPEWLSNDEVGASLEELGHFFEEHDNHYFAAQLFLQALMLKQPPDCHSVILMNNLAAAMAQQVSPVEPGVPPPSRAQLRESGRTWASQALALAASIEAPLRTSECDRGCVVATHNLGEFAEMDGNVAEARDKYEEAVSIAHAVGFQEGVIASNEGLKRVGGKGSGNSSKPGLQSRSRW